MKNITPRTQKHFSEIVHLVEFGFDFNCEEERVDKPYVSDEALYRIAIPSKEDCDAFISLLLKSHNWKIAYIRYEFERFVVIAAIWDMIK